MEVASPRPSRCIFNDLPTQMKIQIFEQLDKKSLSRARGVCLEWALIVRNFFGVYLILRNRNAQYLLSVPNYKTEVKNATIMDLTRLFRGPFPDFTRAITTLQFSNHTNPHTTLKFLMACPALQHLTFSLVQFHHRGLRSVDFTNFTPRAKLNSIQIEVHVKTRKFSNHEVVIFKLLEHFDLRSLESFTLKRRNSRLNSVCDFDFSLRGQRDWNPESRSIIGIAESPATLTRITRFIILQTCLRKLHLENTIILFFSMAFVDSTMRRMPKVEELSAVVMCSEGWGTLLVEQTSLTVLRLEIAWGIWGIVLSCVQRCSTTLKELKIIGFFGVEENHLFNLDFLLPLTKLKKFHIECNNLVKIVKRMPDSLESLCMDGPISEDDLTSIQSTFINLKFLCLKNYGFNVVQHEAVGLSNPSQLLGLELFKLLLSSPKVRKLIFHHCMMKRMEILNYCKGVGMDIQVKSHPATIDHLHIGYFYNLEAIVYSRANVIL